MYLLLLNVHLERVKMGVRKVMGPVSGKHEGDVLCSLVRGPFSQAGEVRGVCARPPVSWTV